ncbi:hypothetical protein B9C88_00625 [Brevibacillus laterosporus]|nr:hypothetical protein B9C88_00625 [Brevibacillus laterosporus]
MIVLHKMFIENSKNKLYFIFHFLPPMLIKNCSHILQDTMTILSFSNWMKDNFLLMETTPATTQFGKLFKKVSSRTPIDYSFLHKKIASPTGRYMLLIVWIFQ